MGKSRRGEREFTREQKLANENRQLKKEIASLRKQLARIDLDRYGHVRDILEKHYAAEEERAGQEFLEKLKEEWKCRACNNGYLEITLYNKRNDTWYYRRCNNCTHRTQSKRYSAEVKGIVKNSNS